MTRPSRDSTMLKLASVISERSTCSRRKVGCVLVDKYGRVLSMGHNGVPRGMTHCIESPCPGAEYPSGTHLEECLAVHAEENALMFCSDIMKIETCYVTTSPCLGCVKKILNSGCDRIIFLEEYSQPGAKELWLKNHWLDYRGISNVEWAKGSC